MGHINRNWYKMVKINRNSLDIYEWEKTKKIIGNKNTVNNIYRMLAYDSVIYAYFYTGFIGFIVWGKILQIYFHQETFKIKIE